MSTLSVTTLTTGNGATDLTISTGNSSAGDIILYANGNGLLISANSSTNTVIISPNGNFVIANSTANTFTVNSVGGVTFSSAISTANGTNLGTHNFGGVGVEINNSGTGDRNAYIDFHSDDTYTDYSFRMIAGAGSNGVRNITTRGTGNFNLITTDAANIVFTTNSSAKATLTSAGAFILNSNTFTLGTSTAAANGYTFLPNGLKMVWGMVAAANTAAGTFATYASAFTTATYVVQVSHQGNARTVAPLVVSSNTTGANISSGIAATTGTNVYFTAIGI